MRLSICDWTFLNKASYRLDYIFVPHPLAFPTPRPPPSFLSVPHPYPLAQN
jgi:hypothetical protein